MIWKISRGNSIIKWQGYLASSRIQFSVQTAGGLLPDAFAIIGIARREMSIDAFRSDLAQALRRFAIRGEARGGDCSEG